MLQIAIKALHLTDLNLARYADVQDVEDNLVH